MKPAKIEVKREKTKFKEIRNNGGYDITSEFKITLIENNYGENTELEGDLNSRWEFEFPKKRNSEDVDEKAKLEYAKLFADAWMKRSNESLSEISGKVEAYVRKLIAKAKKDVKKAMDKKTPKDVLVGQIKSDIEESLKQFKQKLDNKLEGMAKEITEKAAEDAGKKAKKPYAGKMIPNKYQKKLGTTVLKAGAIGGGIAGLAIAAPGAALGVAIAGGVYLALKGASTLMSATKDFVEQTQLYLEARNIALRKNDDAIKAVKAAAEAMRAAVNKQSSLSIRAREIEKNIAGINRELSGNNGEINEKEKRTLQKRLDSLKTLLGKYDDTFENGSPSELLKILEKADEDLEDLKKKSQASVTTISRYADRAKEISDTVEAALSIAV